MANPKILARHCEHASMVNDTVRTCTYGPCMEEAECPFKTQALEWARKLRIQEEAGA